jgi:RNA polymerase sigma factor (sigma-70 family)
MADTSHSSILHYLRRVLGNPAAAGVSDADLLRRYVEQRDEAAFELLLWQHAAMVLHVCRQVLGNEQAAEDAFQATFLVLVRKANSISRREALGSWLYRVAHRIALKALAEMRKRTSVEGELEDRELPAPGDSSEDGEQRRIVTEEVHHLPAKYRAAIIAYYFEAKTLEEAAQQLGWPRGTVASRLSRGRELLRRRLIRRGISLTAATLATASPVQTSTAALTPLVTSTLQTTRLFAASSAVSPHIAALAEGVFQTMYWTKMKIALVVLLLASLGGAGLTLLATQEQKEPAPLDKDKRKAAPPHEMTKSRPEPMKKPPAPVETNAEDRIRPGDLLDIHVGGIPPEAGPIQQRVFQVEASGKIALGPGYGRVDIKGLSLEEAEERILKHIIEKIRGSVVVSVTRPIPDNPGLQRLVQQLKEEQVRMQMELKKLRDEIDAIKKELRQQRESQ